jgi:hypothetical protein
VKRPPGATGLDDHHADAVGDDVLQFAADHQSLVRDGGPFALGAIGGRPGGERGERIGSASALAHEATHQPREREEPDHHG